MKQTLKDYDIDIKNVPLYCDNESAIKIAYNRSPDQICSKNNAPKGFIPFELCLIFLFFETLK